MFKQEDVLEGACQIRYFLPKILGAESKQVEHQLAKLLNQARSNYQVEQILELLKSHPATRQWIAEFLGPKQIVKRYERLPGSGSPVSARRFICPEGDYVWYQRSVGVPVPDCPTHGELILAQRCHK